MSQPPPPAFLPAVDGLTLPAGLRALLRPGEAVADAAGRAHRLPRFFYEIESWARARELRLTPHFSLSELLVVDCREAPRLLEDFPHYAPCALGLLARCLEDFRREAGAPIYLAANGGYRSPAHRLTASEGFDPHAWGAAADIYRVGDTWLNTQGAIEKYAALARALGPDLQARSYGHGVGQTDDHLHVDLGYVHLIPPSCDETAPPPA